jgi:hypothetical protein
VILGGFWAGFWVETKPVHKLARSGIP